MKELTIEQKAKAYDEALERARKFATNLPNGRNDRLYHIWDLESIFPELKENEDERIRKELISWLKSKDGQILPMDRFNAAIAWLEKQGESDETKAKIFLINKGYPIDTNGVFPTYEEMYNIIREGLEKQGEHKFTDEVKPKFKVGDYIERKDGLGCHAEVIVVGENVYGCKKLIYSEDSSPFVEIMFKNQDEFQISSDFKQKPIDTVEPKFHEGERIVWQDKSYKVNYDGCGYESVDENGLSTSLEYGTIDENAHLWDITKDAKDGDVLVLGDIIVIFKELISTVACKCYCNLYEDEFGITKTGTYSCCDAKPATKEQREQLEKAMTDAGYTFNFEKKELKKIEQKPAEWSEEDENRFKNLIMLVNFSDENEPTKKGFIDFINRLKSLKNKL